MSQPSLQNHRSGLMSPLAPFRHRAFFWLWLGVVIASVGTWAQMVGAQWLFVHDPNAATIVTLVQTASTLPMMLLALPAGVLADAFDRRSLMFGVQIYFIVVAALLAGLTAAGLMPPALLLTFTFAVGAGQAMLSPTWQALITELVPRNEFAAATRLDMVSVNVSRAAGPARQPRHWSVSAASAASCSRCPRPSTLTALPWPTGPGNGGPRARARCWADRGIHRVRGLSRP
jgi:MFS family permease